MKVSELLSKLSYGELSGLSWSGEGNGTINEDRIPQILLAANEALLRLHSRFPLKESELILEEQSLITMYQLNLLHSQANPERPVTTPGYIVDSPTKMFADDVLKVFECRTLHGCRLPLNDSEAPYSLFTPYPTTIQINHPVPNRLTSVLYYSRHTPLVDVNSVINLPAALEGALTAYIAHKVFLPMNGQDSAAVAGAHLSTYEGICNEITEMDLVSASVSSTNARFQRNGWI